jgi:hypothetical protein
MKHPIFPTSWYFSTKEGDSRDYVTRSWIFSRNGAVAVTNFGSPGENGLVIWEHKSCWVGSTPFNSCTGWSQSWPVLRNYCSTCLKGLRKTTKKRYDRVPPIPRLRLNIRISDDSETAQSRNSWIFLGQLSNKSLDVIDSKVHYRVHKNPPYGSSP